MSSATVPDLVRHPVHPALPTRVERAQVDALYTKGKTKQWDVDLDIDGRSVGRSRRPVIRRNPLNRLSAPDEGVSGS